MVYITADYTPKVAAETRTSARGAAAGRAIPATTAWISSSRFFRNGPSGDLPPRAFRQEQSGTGFVVDKNGYIITNNHVDRESGSH